MNIKQAETMLGTLRLIIKVIAFDFLLVCLSVCSFTCCFSHMDESLNDSGAGAVNEWGPMLIISKNLTSQHLYKGGSSNLSFLQFTADSFSFWARHNISILHSAAKSIGLQIIPHTCHRHGETNSVRWRNCGWHTCILVHRSIGPLVECQMSKLNKVNFLSDCTSGVPPVIFCKGEALILNKQDNVGVFPKMGAGGSSPFRCHFTE